MRPAVAAAAGLIAAGATVMLDAPGAGASPTAATSSTPVPGVIRTMGTVPPARPAPGFTAARSADPAVANLPLYAFDRNRYYGGINAQELISESDDQLVLSAQHTAAGYRTSAVHTDFFRYGTVSVRAQLPGGAGLWPAVWLVPRQSGPLGTPEIDMVEVPQHTPSDRYVANFVYHWRDAAGVPWIIGTTRRMPFDMTTGMHTYTMRWLPDSITWWVDGVQVMHVEPSPSRSTGIARAHAGQPSSHIATPRTIPIFDGELQLLINNAVGSPGSWSGPPNATTRFPNQLRIASISISPSSPTTAVRSATAGRFTVVR